ncbi:TPA: DNA mismatch repair protein MutS [Candidatus Dependentiae bacterium]|nr:MAG: mismatch repair protein MutS protein [candidate division TM6 bacterium GW2011_GWE2_31_21]KKP53499.1 MAG: mismatch repair protein MutS protein [candidate division TM6 bacterium GW2011_GWF2_33_332]HBS48261.1 DNA mismatch repair protein MutS [Candidatus Dependentiae bacterium]HBZ73687.1 DNA mismatch repair protein MutS [Candidatus Dependentiae bacterium]
MEEKLTPLMEQYFQIKNKLSNENPDTILFYQVGDFYELFFEDAKTVSSFLAIALTKRGKCKGLDIPLCGIPVHAIRHYLTKLIKGGFKVAICDQLTEPKPGTVVERGITQIYTPGTLTDSLMLDEKAASYLFSFYPMQDQWGLIFGELLTTQLFATVLPQEAFRSLENELARFSPDEIIISNNFKNSSFDSFFKKLGYPTSPTSFENEKDDIAGPQFNKEWLLSQFGEKDFKKIDYFPALQNSIFLFFSYLQRTQNKSIEQFKQIQFYEPEDFLILDSATQKNLELVKNSIDGGRKNTLFEILDNAKTAMGSRTVKKWITRPLIQKNAILQRQEVVTALSNDVQTLQTLEQQLSTLADIERIVGRIALGKAMIQDYLALKDSLAIIDPIKKTVSNLKQFDLIKIISEKLGNFNDLLNLLQNSLNQEITNNFLIKLGFDVELDRLRDLAINAQKAILELEQKEVARSKINSLKISYNKISGYYIEITKTNLHLVPADYIRQQTLSNKERFITPELSLLERDITKAQNEIDAVEAEVFAKIKNQIFEELPHLRQLAHALSYLDALYSFASVAYGNSYVAPQFNESRNILITDGRHPVIEQKLSNKFIANDTTLTDKESLLIITGPNMGGKSTYLRQVALISIMAQCGSLIPAKAASLPILDRIFTRIGSGDNLAEGKSTFLVEMEETASICNQATKNSLVILDEVGRGTSTYDGLALAQAVVEFIYEKIEARCLFATHYHELTHLKDHFDGIQNYYMSSRKTDSGILFLYKIIPGFSQGSFGLEVAKLAQLPVEIISRAGKILQALDIAENKFDQNLFQKQNLQQSFFNQNSDELANEINYLKNELSKKNLIIDEIKKISLDEISPRQALDILWELKKKI